MTSRHSSSLFLLVCFLFAMSPSILAAQIRVALPEVSGRPGTDMIIPVRIGELTGEKVTAFEFVVSCDTNIVLLKGVDQKGTLSEGLTMFANNLVAPFGRGRMKVVCASANPLSGHGVLVNILASARMRNGTTPLKLTEFVLNAGKPSVETIHGVAKIGRKVATRK